MVSRIEVGWRQGEKEGTIPVDVVYSKRRTIGLEVQADGKVLIRAPKGITKKVLMDFVKDRQEWIVEKWFLIEKHRRKKKNGANCNISQFFLHNTQPLFVFFSIIYHFRKYLNYS